MSTRQKAFTCTHAILDPRREVRICSMSDEEFIDLVANAKMPQAEWLGHMLLEHTEQLAAFLAKLAPLP